MKAKKIYDFFTIIVGLSPFFYWVITRINQDGWWDELISLKEYALVSLDTVTSTYPDPNNHILFNLINNLFIKILGFRNFYEVLDYMYNLRILQAFFALITIYYAFIIIRIFFNKEYAFIIVATLCSTVPFLNFSLQLRGYNLSMMFTAMIIFHTWNYSYQKRKIDIIILPLLIFFSLYTIPSNIYFLLALFVTVLFDWKRKRSDYKKGIESKHEKKKKQQQLSSVFRKIDKTYLQLILAASIGITICFIAYLPIIENLLNNRFVTKAPQERLYVITTLLPQILKSFFSAKWLLLPCIPIYFFLWLNTKKRNTYSTNHKLRYLIIIFLLPFLLIVIHNKLPFQRTFIMLTPVFSLIISVLIIGLIEKLSLKPNYKHLVLSILSIYFICTSFIELSGNDKQLNLNLQSEVREQNIYRNYYLSRDFNPHNVAKRIAKMNDIKMPVVMLDELDRVSLTFYLEKYDIPSQAVIRIQQNPVTANKQNFNHVGLIQKSVGKNQDINYMQIPCNLPVGDKLNPYFLLLELNNQKPPFQKFILLSAYPNRIMEIEKKMNNYHFEKINSKDFVTLRKVQKKI